VSECAFCEFEEKLDRRLGALAPLRAGETLTEDHVSALAYVLTAAEHLSGALHLIHRAAPKIATAAMLASQLEGARRDAAARHTAPVVDELIRRATGGGQPL
jgi:hypothetical protein